MNARDGRWCVFLFRFRPGRGNDRRAEGERAPVLPMAHKTEATVREASEESC